MWKHNSLIYFSSHETGQKKYAKYLLGQVYTTMYMPVCILSKIKNNFAYWVTLRNVYAHANIR